MVFSFFFCEKIKTWHSQTSCNDERKHNGGPAIQLCERILKVAVRKGGALGYQGLKVGNHKSKTTTCNVPTTICRLPCGNDCAKYSNNLFVSMKIVPCGLNGAVCYCHTVLNIALHQKHGTSRKRDKRSRFFDTQIYMC